MKETILTFPELFPKELNGIVYRYSSPTVFEKTLSKKNLWFTRGDCFNDYEDGEVVSKLYPACLKELLVEKIIDKEFFVDAAMIELKHLVWLFGDDIVTRIECNPYICCFSTEKDSLQMWQYYSKGSNYEGYNLGFRLHELLSVNPCFVHFGAVIYDEAIQKSLIKKAVTTAYIDYHDNLAKNQQMSFDQQRLLNIILDSMRSNLTKLSCFFKRSCFSGEKEIRVVINVPIEEKYRNSTWSGTEQPVSIRYRFQNALMIPYVEMDINPRSFECATIGPITSSKNIALEKNTAVVKEFVSSCLGRTVPVSSSEIPVRF